MSSILDSFGRNERSGMGGRNRVPICVSSYSSTEMCGQDTDHHSLSSHRSGAATSSSSKQPQQQKAVVVVQPVVPGANGDVAWDPNMFGDNTASLAGSVSVSHHHHHQSVTQQPPHFQQQQPPPPAQLPLASVQHHELDCDDGDLSLERYHQQRNQDPAPVRQQQQQQQRSFFSEQDRQALEDIATTDDFMERFNELAAQLRRAAATTSPSLGQQNNINNNDRGSEERQSHLVPLCPSCFTKNVRSQGVPVAKLKPAAAQAGRRK